MNEIKRMQELAGINTNDQYSEYRLDWEIPGESNNSIVGNSIEALVKIAKAKNIEKYRIKGYIGGNRWDTIIDRK
jgi:hypothetical protein